MNIKSFKMPFQNKHFNKNQRVWVLSLSGYEAAFCAGKFRGKHRYVKAWVNWRAKNKENPKIQEFDVHDSFFDKLYCI